MSEFYEYKAPETYRTQTMKDAHMLVTECPFVLSDGGKTVYTE